MYILNLEKVKEHCIEEYPKEACGLIIEDSFIPIPNVSSSPINSFKMEAGTFLTYEKKIQAIVHSHTGERHKYDPRTPSLEDLELTKRTGKPQGILHCDGESVSPILWFNDPEDIPPLLGRIYIPGVYDCFTLVRDYYLKEASFVIDLLPRPPEWQKWNPRYIIDNLEGKGFSKLSLSTPLVKGDVLIFSIGSRLPNHLGIYTGENTFIHHAGDRKSTEEPLDKWKKLITCAYRLGG